MSEQVALVLEGDGVTDTAKPMPEPTPTTQPFWDALRRHRVHPVLALVGPVRVLPPRAGPGDPGRRLGVAGDLREGICTPSHSTGRRRRPGRTLAPVAGRGRVGRGPTAEPRWSTSTRRTSSSGCGQAGFLRLPRRWHHLVALRAGLTPDPWGMGSRAQLTSRRPLFTSRCRGRVPAEWIRPDRRDSPRTQRGQPCSSPERGSIR